MKVTGSTIQQLDRKRKDGSDKPKSECRKWRLWATTEQGRKSKRYGGTYTQAQKALDAFVEELEGFVPNAETFAAYADSWRLWREKACGLGEQTLANDKRNVDIWKRELGHMRMDEITPEDVKAALLSVKTGGARELSGTYMNNLFVALNNIMRTAHDDGRIASNPCAKVKPPKCDTREKEALSAPEMDALWRALEPLAAHDGRAMAVLIVLDAGLRLGEVLALSPADVDLRTRRIHVRGSRNERSGKVGSTKRPASERDLPMTERLERACRAYAANRPCACDAFCASPRGQAIRAQNFRRWWDGRAAEWGAAGFTPHQLRHSNLTKMARFMSPFDLQRWAGWSSIAPAKVYVHADMDSLEAAVLRSQVSASRVIECTENAPEREAGQTA